MPLHGPWYSAQLERSKYRKEDEEVAPSDCLPYTTVLDAMVELSVIMVADTCHILFFFWKQQCVWNTRWCKYSQHILNISNAFETFKTRSKH